jgi:hypothetical protein
MLAIPLNLHNRSANVVQKQKQGVVSTRPLSDDLASDTDIPCSTKLSYSTHVPRNNDISYDSGKGPENYHFDYKFVAHLVNFPRVSRPWKL